MQIATVARFNVFAGTPPLKFVRLATRFADSMIPSNEKGERLPGLWDVRSAFYHAEIDESVHVVPPRRKDEPGVVWQLKRAVYGASVASKSFQSLLIELLVGHGKFARLEVTIMVSSRS